MGSKVPPCIQKWHLSNKQLLWSYIADLGVGGVAVERRRFGGVAVGSFPLSLPHPHILLAREKGCSLNTGADLCIPSA